MPYPRWLAKINKRVFNPGQIRKGKYPVVVHIGRKSGTEYLTPTDAHPCRNGYVLVVRYGPGSDWVRNIQAAGTATLRIHGEDIRLDSPRLVSQQDAVKELVPGYDPGKDFYRAADFLVMERAA